MNYEERSAISRYMAYLLRWAPESAGLALDDAGWTDTKKFIAAVARKHPGFTAEKLQEIVERDGKKRYSFSCDGTRIRAVQGHSKALSVNPDLTEGEPPEKLYHGTSEEKIPLIFDGGLSSMLRRYVHLSPDQKTASQVGSRHGRPVVFGVEAGRMYRDGYAFYQAENGVWLTERVPPRYLIWTEMFGTRR